MAFAEWASSIPGAVASMNLVTLLRRLDVLLYLVANAVNPSDQTHRRETTARSREKIGDGDPERSLRLGRASV